MLILILNPIENKDADMKIKRTKRKIIKKGMNLSPIATTMQVSMTPSLIFGQASPFYGFIFCAMFTLTLSLIACTKFCHCETTVDSGDDLPTGYNSLSNKIWVH
ncbi:hypothetical protein ES319_D13G186600v1 [Gossypium barbadense]|uniref:Uncharacterized protein n=2 Tax=Gossypium TaxID=3633 RepID=A0A5J5NRL9_GOSBA|nr:hypothetical protein ES319_D13G186600v1 [Gossypium barbadense]TYG38143.1 hypothetical protein ES288_D13G198000v1 [Gossypium darwinii]